MDKQTAQTVANMLIDEASRWSLAELCEEWGVTVEDVDEFIGAALEAATE